MTIHDKVANDLKGFGGLLRCDKCGKEIQLELENIGLYLRSGWPEHCGYTMTWVTARQLKLERDKGEEDVCQ